MSNIEKIIKQAISTFAKPQSASKYQESFNALIQNASKLTAEDVGIDKDLVNLHNRGPDSSNPVGYVPVYEDNNILVSIFILKSNSAIPLHDHPVMYGILKVLHGSVHIQSYSPVNGKVKQYSDDKLYSMNDCYHVSGELYTDPFLVRRNTPVILSAKDGCGTLTPFENNIHEVKSVNGPSAFLDILAPPYQTYLPQVGSRQCSYLDVKNYSDKECSLSVAVYHPQYWTVALPYRGPMIKI